MKESEASLYKEREEREKGSHTESLSTCHGLNVKVVMDCRKKLFHADTKEKNCFTKKKQKQKEITCVGKL